MLDALVLSGEEHMTHLQAERRATALATLVSALVGSGLFVLLSFYWPRAIIVWMRVIVPRSIYPAPVELALKVTVVFVAVGALLAIVVLGVRWVLRCLKVSRPATALAVILTLAFALSFAAEATFQVVNTRGNLTASDATGIVIYDARLTAHGWETILRRAAAASLYAGAMAAAFWVVTSVLRRRQTRL